MSKSNLIRLFGTSRMNRVINNHPSGIFLLNLTHNLKFPNLQIRTCQSTPKKCWKCGLEPQMGDLFCRNCKVIQNPQETEDYFKLFNLKFDFDVDQKILSSLYRKMQTVLHPDKFAKSSPEERKISAEYSSLVNKGFNTLQAPLSRALHMLKLCNETIEEENKSDDVQFLMEVMELNEELEEAESEEKLRRIEEKNKEMIKSVSKVISKYFKEGNVIEAKKAIVRMKYYDSLSKRISDLLREKGIVD